MAESEAVEWRERAASDGSMAIFKDVFQWTPPPWIRNASCRSAIYRPSWWFRGGNKKIDRQIRERAKAICIYECPVRYRCLSRFLQEPGGIFGGMDDEERTELAESVHFELWSDPDALRAKVEGHLMRERQGVRVEIRSVS